MNLRHHFFISVLFLVLSGCSWSGDENQNDNDEENPQETIEDDLDTTISIDGSSLSGIYADPIRAAVYVADKLQNKVHIIDTATKSVTASIDVGSMPTQMDTTADGSLLLVMHSGGAGVSVINLNTQTRDSVIALSGLPSSIAVSSNDHLYVAYEGGAADPDLEAYDISSPGAAAYTVNGAPWGWFISGRSADRTMIYLHDLTTSSTVYQWDVGGLPPALVQDDNIASGEPTITPVGASLFMISPSGRWSGGRFPNYNGDVLVHRASDQQAEATLNVEWTATAVATNLMGDKIAIAHDDSLTNPTSSVSARHDPTAYDLHIFDYNGLTFTESESYSLPSFVHRHGIAFAANGDIYVLLGKSTSTSIGVIVP